jgi:thiol-disulfide isomerase/thioredoxin
MATGPKPHFAHHTARHVCNVVRLLALALAAVLAPVQAEAQALENGALKTAAPKNFVMHETPEPGVVLRFEDGDAQPHSLADFRGRTVLLNIWATWCLPCLREIPALDHLAVALHDANVVVVAVSIDRKGIDEVRKTFAELHVQKLVPYIDRSGQALRTVRGMGLPMSLLVDGEGREIGRIVGPAAWDENVTVAFFRHFGTPPPEQAEYGGAAAAR